MFRTLRSPKFRLMDYFIIILLGHVKRRPCKKDSILAIKGLLLCLEYWRYFVVHSTHNTLPPWHILSCSSLLMSNEGIFLLHYFFGTISKLGVFSLNLMFTILFNMWMLGSNKWTFNYKWNSKMLIVKMVLLALLFIK